MVDEAVSSEVHRRNGAFNVTLRTNHIQLVRGSTLSVTRIARNDKLQALDLTGAEIWLAMRADIKISPSVMLTSKVSPPSQWRTGVVISDQNVSKGEYVYTFVPNDTSGLVALGHDDPWLYDVKIKLADGSVITDVALSNVDLYPQSTDIPP